MPKILVIDDQTGGLEFLSAILSAGGYVLLTAECAREGLEIARAEAPDLVIGDVTPPRAEGGALLGLLRAEAGTAMVPVLLYAIPGSKGVPPVTERESTESAGPVRFLARPENPATVFATVAAILKEASAARDGGKPEEAAPAVSGPHDKILTARVAAQFSRLEAAIAALRQMAGGERRNFGLTIREAAALRLLMQGHDHKSIAAELGVAYITARLELQGAFTKLGAQDELEAVRIARRAGLGGGAKRGL